MLCLEASSNLVVERPALWRHDPANLVVASPCKLARIVVIPTESKTVCGKYEAQVENHFAVGEICNKAITQESVRDEGKGVASRGADACGFNWRSTLNGHGKFSMKHW